MTKKLKGCRPLDEINTEYSIACGNLGNFIFRQDVISREIERVKQRLTELDLEAGAAKQQMEKQAAEDAEKVPAPEGEVPAV